MAHDTYHRWHGELTEKIRTAKAQIDQSGKDQNEIHFLLKSELNKLSDMRHVYRSSTVLQKQELLRAVLDNRLYWQDCLYRTITWCNSFINLLILKEKKLLELDVNKKPDIKSGQVEVTGFEPVSKHILQKLSTCLFRRCLSGNNRNRTHQLFP